MTLHPPKPLQKFLKPAALWACIAALVSGCSTPPPPPPPPAQPAPVVVAPPPPPPAPVAAPALPIRSTSAANSLEAYRRDVAIHLYAQNNHGIYLRKMPPLLYAVGVLETDIDARGYVIAVRWMRAPSHAPEVMVQIERMVRQASPYPAPIHLGKVTYTDTWLWHKSGRFQLHTLSEGQL
jgi:periplasmic protein TonB